MSLGIDFYGTGEVTLLQRELKSIFFKNKSRSCILFNVVFVTIKGIQNLRNIFVKMTGDVWVIFVR